VFYLYTDSPTSFHSAANQHWLGTLSWLVNRQEIEIIVISFHSMRIKVNYKLDNCCRSDVQGLARTCAEILGPLNLAADLAVLLAPGSGSASGQLDSRRQPTRLSWLSAHAATGWLKMTDMKLTDMKMTDMKLEDKFENRLHYNCNYIAILFKTTAEYKS